MQARHCPTSRILWRGLLAAALLCLPACRSYQLGHAAELPFETIFVEPAGNESDAPQAQAIVSAKVREAILRDSRVKLTADKKDADVVLDVLLTAYDRDAANRDPRDTEVALDYDLTLTSRITLLDQRSGEYLFRSRTVSAEASAFVNDLSAPAGTADTQSFLQAEHQAMPRIARELARQIANEVLGAW
ncbi:MAG: LPS assembly lipoprotein LptE [Opitutales bacterium]